MNACSDSGLPRVCSARPARNSPVPDAERQSRALGVAPVAARVSVMFFVVKSTDGLRRESVIVAVGHDPQPLSDVRSADARSADIERPCGVTLDFQVRENKVEPSEAVLACNLLAKDDARAALRDEPVPSGP